MLLKFKQTINQWVSFYSEAIRNRCRRDLNLSDVMSIQAARDNLGLSGNNNHTHYHDDRYLPLIAKANSDTINSLKSSTLSVTGDALSNPINLDMNSKLVLVMKDVKATESYITSAVNGVKYLMVCDDGASAGAMINKNYSIDIPNNIISFPNMKCLSISCAGSIVADRVYNGVWNDYAEFFPRGEETIPGDLIMLDMKSDSEKYVKAVAGDNCLVVGVHSDEFGFLIGGDSIEDDEDFYDKNIKNFIPVGLAGRVLVNFIGDAKKGGAVVPSNVPGCGKLYEYDKDDIKNVVGYLVESDNLTDKRKLKIKIK